MLHSSGNLKRRCLKLDSLFYENIPGKIISKKKINRNGYSGFDLVNRTRRGDLQRNLILVTPFEVLFFKMNGPDNYVDGPEAERFFSSVSLKPADLSSGEFQPEQGGFSIRFPASPGIYKKENSPDGTGRWEYESLDKATGNAYLVFVKSIHHFGFLDEDSFDLRLMEESFRNPDHVSGNISRRPGTFEGYPCLEVTERMKDGAIVRARFIIRGPYYYLIASRINGGSDSTRIIESFRFTPFKYPPARNFTDTFMHFTVSTPVLPDLDEGIRSLIEKTNTLLETRNVNLGFAGYWPKAKKGLFKSPATGEMVGVTRQEYPKYYYISDPAKFWKGELDDYTMKNDLSLVSKDTLFREGQISGFRFQLRDTGSSRTIFRQIMLNDQYYYALVSMGDTVSGTGPFVNEFFNSFRPEPVKKEKSIYSNRLGLFFTDLFSSDSLVRSLARQSISNIYFGEEGIPGIMDAISRLKMTDKDYFESKVKLIAELGYIKDTLNRQVVPALKKIYESTGDTSLFHNEVFRALARHKTRESYALLKEYILQDPPVFESDYEYSGLFASLADSLALTKSLSLRSCSS
ncbi:MAG: hypothetical protein IPI66_15740 [Chitinophagaceae bacterium]|nr:hypothetical protein [Chitinophagaceae bacterium]